MASLRVNRDVIRIANKITGSAETGRYFRMGMPILLIVFFFSEECSSKGGTNDGTCASGFGVCCTCKFLLKA